MASLRVYLRLSERPHRSWTIVGRAQPREGQSGEAETEVTQRHIVVATDEEEVDDDSDQPTCDDVGANPRPEGDDKPSDDLDDTDHSHGCSRAHRREAQEGGSKVFLPIA